MKKLAVTVAVIAVASAAAWQWWQAIRRDTAAAWAAGTDDVGHG